MMPNLVRLVREYKGGVHEDEQGVALAILKTAL